MNDQDDTQFDHSGPNIDSLLKEEGILEGVEAAAVQRDRDFQRGASDVVPQDQELFGTQMALAQKIMRKRRRVLRRLSK